MQFDTEKVGKDKLGMLHTMVERDPLDLLHEHEKEMIWNLRYECNFHFRKSLPKLLSCVRWNNHVDVAQVGKARNLHYIRDFEKIAKNTSGKSRILLYLCMFLWVW